MGRGANALVDEALQAFTDSVGEKARELPSHGAPSLRLQLLPSRLVLSPDRLLVGYSFGHHLKVSIRNS